MKIKFTNRLYDLPVSLDREYQVLGYYTDWFNNRTEWHKMVLFLDDNKMPHFINATFLDDIKIEDSPFPFETTTEYFGTHISIMPKEWNLQNRTQIDGLDLGWYQLRYGNIWAVTQFVDGLNKIGIQANDEYAEIASSDKIKIWYIKGLMNGIFETVCNYFARCSNTQYTFTFDKIPHDTTIMPSENIVEVADFQNEILDNLYKQFVEYSDFGIFLKRSNDPYFSDEGRRNCLRDAIKRIALTIGSIFYAEPKLSVYEHKLEFPWKYCLYFVTPFEKYKFYLSNLD